MICCKTWYRYRIGDTRENLNTSDYTTYPTNNIINKLTVSVKRQGYWTKMKLNISDYGCILNVHMNPVLSKVTSSGLNWSRATRMVSSTQQANCVYTCNTTFTYIHIHIQIIGMYIHVQAYLYIRLMPE